MIISVPVLFINFYIKMNWLKLIDSINSLLIPTWQVMVIHFLSNAQCHAETEFGKAHVPEQRATLCLTRY